MKQFVVEVLMHYRLELTGARIIKTLGTIDVKQREERFTVKPRQYVKFIPLCNDNGALAEI